MTKKENSLENVLPEEREVLENVQENGEITLGRDFDNTASKESEIDPELEQSIEDQIASITSKCKFNEDYVKNNIILSVNHLKQFFFFGKVQKNIN